MLAGLSNLTSALAPPAVLPSMAPSLQNLAPLGLPPNQLGLVPPPGLAHPMAAPVGVLAAPSIITPMQLANPQEALRRAHEQAQVLLIFLILSYVCNAFSKFYLL